MAGGRQGSELRKKGTQKEDRSCKKGKCFIDNAVMKGASRQRIGPATEKYRQQNNFLNFPGFSAD